ncbi:MAG TPA: flagellar hook capping FlgD N-terminal domain-containing protein [Myxococcales bacterium]|nr:flagellar hook capping FlgD N-terminal domain-containing protein [Myxococcales bacterium]
MATASNVSPLSNTAQVAAATPSGPTLGKDDFLKLLMAQMANQDPLSPMDDTAFVAQLAQFSNVEQLQTANSTLSSLLTAQAAGNQTAATSMVGKDVQWRSSQVQLGAGPATLHAQLDSSAAAVTATITDSTGRTVRTLQVADAGAGPLNISWDGRDDSGNALPPGTYGFNVTAADMSGNPVNVTQSASGLVTGISFAGGTAQLIVNGQDVNLSDVIEIDQATN